jgi:3-(3-hydroxy-phenyl)propionate hydroxylase/flavoprotein hydroxylase
MNEPSGEIGATETVDVVVVGYGPVGMAMAALLGRAGHRVLVLERYAGLYNLPRAAIFDDETMRTFAALGISEALLPKIHVQRNYEWRNGAGELLIEHDFAETGRSGWAEWYMMYQPELEEALDAVCRAASSVEVRYSSPVTAVEAADGVTVTVDSPSGRQHVRASYVVACDGGNSFVRQTLGIDQHDYGFSEPWMVCDFRLKRPVKIPPALQIGDPRQPTSVISLGPAHHRFSFMLDSVETFETERPPERVWARVARWLSPEDADLIRVATYTFRSLVADDWRVGRVVLAGDAAHQMPPFLGQGMCSGIRDAQNLAFKLDLLLAGTAGADLLDTYQLEREPHVRAVIEKGIELGRMQTMRDPELAAARDRELLARRAGGEALESIRFPGLHDGLLAASSGPGRGELSVQGVVDDGVQRDRLDQVVGSGFQFLLDPELLPALAQTSLGALRRAGVRIAAPAEQAVPQLGVADVEGTYKRWFAALNCRAVVVRPDFYVFGTAVDADGVERLAAELLGVLGAAVGPAAERDAVPIPIRD